MRFGQITEAEPDRSPDGYCYDLSYLVDVVVSAEHIMGQDSRHVFAPDGQSRGLGEVVSEIVQKAWCDLHTGLLSKGNFEIVNGIVTRTGNEQPGQLPLSENNWWVKDWTFSVGGEIADTNF